MLSIIPSTSLCLQPSTAIATPAHSTKNTASSRLPAAGNPTKAPQPYGIIPPRRKNSPVSVAHPHSSSILSLSSPGSALDNASVSTAHSFLFSDSPCSRPGFWATLKAQYLDLSGYYRSISSSSTKRTKSRLSAGCVHDFASPVARLVSNSSPIVTLDATPLVTSSSTDDAILSLPNVDSLSWSNISISSSSNGALLGGMYPVSVAAMDKFKIMHTDIIPLKTFAYCETLVEEVKRPSRPTAATARAVPLVKRSMPKAPPLPFRRSANTQTSPGKTDELPLPLPRHLASRETRSNSDYLRMMASEISMIRSRKLIAPLKPRGYLPRRKELFRAVKSSLSASVEMACEEDDDLLFVGSWTSVSSTESFLSAASSSYATADDEEFE